MLVDLNKRSCRRSASCFTLTDVIDICLFAGQHWNSCLCCKTADKFSRGICSTYRSDHLTQQTAGWSPRCQEASHGAIRPCQRQTCSKTWVAERLAARGGCLWIHHQRLPRRPAPTTINVTPIPSSHLRAAQPTLCQSATPQVRCDYRGLGVLCCN